MSTATKLQPSALAERITKVRNRMFVATLTQVSPSNKELFIALCQIYEQQNAEKSSFSSELSDDLPLFLQVPSFVHKTEENPRQQWPECILMKKFHPWMVEDFTGHVGGDEGDFMDWDKAG